MIELYELNPHKMTTPQEKAFHLFVYDKINDENKVKAKKLALGKN